jgi:anti-sigma B factor antagonist
MNKDIEVIIETLSGKAEVQVITIKGTIDVVTSKDVDEKGLPIIEKGNSNIILDLSNVVYLSSTGMMCLIRYYVYSNAKQCILKLVRPPDPVYHTLQLTGIAKHFDICDSVGDAIEKLMNENK